VQNPITISYLRNHLNVHRNHENFGGKNGENPMTQLAKPFNKEIVTIYQDIKHVKLSGKLQKFSFIIYASHCNINPTSINSKSRRGRRCGIPANTR
jgi:hypothetical protein